MKNYIQKVALALVLLLAATLSLSAKDGTAVRKLFKKGVSDSISVGGSKLVVLQRFGTGISHSSWLAFFSASGLPAVHEFRECGNSLPLRPISLRESVRQGSKLGHCFY